MDITIRSIYHVINETTENNCDRNDNAFYSAFDIIW